MGSLPPLPSARDLLKLYNVRAVKRLSQNFLLDSRKCDEVVKGAGRLKDIQVCEVGPGPGSITRAILRRNPSRLVLIEKDARFLPSLEQLVESCSIPVRVVRGDVLNVSLENMFSEDSCHPWTDSPPPIRIIGNLPFNISTPLLIRWLEAVSERRDAWRYGRVPLTLTFQKEVADRIVAPILSSSRCRLSFICQNWFIVKRGTTLPGRCFTPPPQVDVGVVTLEPRVQPLVNLPFRLVEKVAACLFNSKRRFLKHGIGLLFPLGERERLTEVMLELSGLEYSNRPFMLSTSEMGRLVEAYSTLLSAHPSLARYKPRGPRSTEFSLNGDDDDDEDDDAGEPLIIDYGETTDDKRIVDKHKLSASQ